MLLESGYPEPIRFLGLSEFIQTALGVPLLTAEIITVGLIILIFFLPTFLMKTTNYVSFILGIFLLTSLTAIGWLPVYTWVLLCLYIAIEISGHLKGFY